MYLLFILLSLYLFHFSFLLFSCTYKWLRLILIFIDLTLEYDPETDEFFSHDSSKFPRCQEKGCNSYLRPDAVLFTEAIPDDDWNSSYRAVQEVIPSSLYVVVWCGMV